MADEDLAGEEDVALEADDDDGLLQNDPHRGGALHQPVFGGFYRYYGLLFRNAHNLSGWWHELRVFLGDHGERDDGELPRDHSGFFGQDAQRRLVGVSRDRYDVRVSRGEWVVRDCVSIATESVVIGGVVSEDVVVRVVVDVGLRSHR